MVSATGQMKVGFQGETGAYSEEALLALFPEAGAAGFRTFALVFEALSTGEVEAAVLPVENSLAGIVQEVNDLLWEHRPGGVRISREHVHPVRHCLLGRPGPVQRALSHPQALAQCRRWLEAHEIEAVPYHDTAGAARHVAKSSEPALAAIASAGAGRRYGLEVVASGIQDDSSNRTRFLVVERGEPQRPASGRPNHKVSLAFVGAHRPGSLVAALKRFSDRDINLTRLDSRPIQDRPFHYRFYLDFEVGEPDQAEAALAALEAEAAEVRLFGTYPAYSDPTLSA
jgi:prephenate dehydratase